MDVHSGSAAVYGSNSQLLTVKDEDLSCCILNCSRSVSPRQGFRVELKDWFFFKGCGIDLLKKALTFNCIASEECNLVGQIY